MLSLLDDPGPCGCCDPHPELVAIQRVTPAEVAMAAAFGGWLPEVPYLKAAVPA